MILFLFVPNPGSIKISAGLFDYFRTTISFVTPALFILYSKVEGGTPSISAAPFLPRILPPQRFSVSKMSSVSASCNVLNSKPVDFGIFLVFSKTTFNEGPSVSKTERSITCSWTLCFCVGKRYV